MFQRTKLHNGLMSDCITCTPDRKKKRERKGYDKPKRVRAGTLEMVLRRQMSEEIGEDELSKDSRFQVMQHYGLIAPRIDRRVTKPNWMEVSRWKVLKQEFHNLTKGLVPEYRSSKPRPTNPTETKAFPNKRYPYRGNLKFETKRQRPISPPQA